MSGNRSWFLLLVIFVLGVVVCYLGVQLSAAQAAKELQAREAKEAAQVAAAAAAVQPVEDRRQARQLLREFEVAGAEDVTVPEGELWHLRFTNTYEPYAITPAYDVRVSAGGCYPTADLKTQINGFEGPLDLNWRQVAGKPAEVWLTPGATFYTANDMVQAQVAVYPY